MEKNEYKEEERQR